MLNHQHLIMSQEHYRDLLQEAEQERLLQYNRQPGSNPLVWLRRRLFEMLRTKVSLDHRLNGWKGAH